MKKQDSGFGMQDSGAGRGVLHPEYCIPNPETIRRLHWRCRRGLLELDIVLGRFVEQRYPAMNDEQRVAFDELLDLPDTELWDLITGKIGLTHAHQGVVLGWLKDV